MSNADHIRSYYAALNTGDAEEVSRHFTDDAVHWYTRLGPHRGAKEIGDNAAWAVREMKGQWHLEHLVEGDDDVAIEWSMTWRDPKSGDARINRGAELFAFRDGLISEVRAYHHGDRNNPEGNLLGFDHEGRGHTMPPAASGPTPKANPGPSGEKR